MMEKHDARWAEGVRATEINKLAEKLVNSAPDYKNTIFKQPLCKPIIFSSKKMDRNDLRNQVKKMKEDFDVR
jgi:hypothetical protein